MNLKHLSGQEVVMSVSVLLRKFVEGKHSCSRPYTVQGFFQSFWCTVI